MTPQDRANAFLKRLVKTIPEGIVGGATPVHTPGIKPVKPKPGLSQGARDRIKTRIGEQRNVREADEIKAEQGKPLSTSTHSHSGLPHVLREVHHHDPNDTRYRTGPATKKERIQILAEMEDRRNHRVPIHDSQTLGRNLQRSGYGMRGRWRGPLIKPPRGYDHYGYGDNPAHQFDVG